MSFSKCGRPVFSRYNETLLICQLNLTVCELRGLIHYVTRRLYQCLLPQELTGRSQAISTNHKDRAYWISSENPESSLERTTKSWMRVAGPQSHCKQCIFIDLSHCPLSLSRLRNTISAYVRLFPSPFIGGMGIQIQELIRLLSHYIPHQSALLSALNPEGFGELHCKDTVAMECINKRQVRSYKPEVEKLCFCSLSFSMVVALKHPITETNENVMNQLLLRHNGA